MSVLRDLVRHVWPSARGFVRYAFERPDFAWKLLWKRGVYTLTRRLNGSFGDGRGFVFATFESLISYWSMFVEGEIQSAAWADALRTAERPLAVDVGANAGVFTHMVLLFNPRARVIAFEPQPPMAQKIRDYAVRTGADIQVIEKAVGAQEGKAWLCLHHDGDGVAFIADAPAPGLKSRQVDVVTLDRALDGCGPIAVFKLDVEGHEVEVLQGAAAVLGRADFLIAEAHTTADLEALKMQLGGRWSPVRVGRSDYLFARDSH